MAEDTIIITNELRGISVKKEPVQLLNTTSIESSHGFRSINLYHGDICTANDELLAISSHASDQYLSGMVMTAIADNFRVRFDQLNPLLRIMGSETVGTFSVHRQPNKDNHPSKQILLVRVPGVYSIEQFGMDPLEVYNEVVWSLFGSLAALEQKGESFKSMAMPLLAGQRGFSELEIMEVLLRQSARWLKTSQRMQTINIYLYEEGHLKVWSEAMDRVLGRRMIDSAKHQVLRALRDEILARMEGSQKFKAKEMVDVVRPLKEALSTDKICLQLVAAFSRKLVEEIVLNIHAEKKIQPKSNLQGDIQTLYFQQIVAPWVTSHFHVLRVFGNETLHSKTAVNFRPSELHDDDLVPVLSSLGSVVHFWTEW